MKSHSRQVFFSTIYFRLGIILLVTTAGAIWLYQRGPLPVMRGTTPLPGTVPTWYMLSAFPVLGMLIADLLSLWERTGLSIPVFELGIQIGILVALSNLRIAVAILLGGHALLFGYALARRLLVPFPEQPTRGAELGVIVILGILTSYVKFFWWDDPITLFAGIGLGAALAFVSFLLLRVSSAWRVLKEI